MNLFHFGARPPHAAERHDDALSPSSDAVVPTTSVTATPAAATGEAGVVIGLTAPAIPFLHPGCTREDSILAVQVASAHNLTGRFHPLELIEAATAAFEAGDTRRAFLYLRHVKAARRRGVLA